MNRNDTPVTATASSDSDEAKDQLQSSQEPRVGYSFSTDLTTPPPEREQLIERLGQLVHQGGISDRPYAIFTFDDLADFILADRTAQLQALKQALPKDYRPERYNVDACLNHEHYTGACVGCQRQKTRVYTLTEVETLIDTHIARIGEKRDGV